LEAPIATPSEKTPYHQRYLSGYQQPLAAVMAHPALNPESAQDFHSPKPDRKGRYITSPKTRNRTIDLRIFLETQLKRFLRWLTAKPPLLRILFTWLLIKKAKMKLAYFDQGELQNPTKVYQSKADPRHAITAAPESTAMTIQNLGHATQLIQTSGMTLLTDPVFGDLAPIVYPGMTRSFHQDVAPHELPPIDVILISHDHRDHVDAPSLKRVLKYLKPHHPQPLLLVPVGNAALFRGLGFTHVQTFEWHEQMTLTSRTGETVTVCSAPADHRSGRQGHDAHHALVMGWMISPNDAPDMVYFAGDTARLNDPRMTSLALDIYHLYQQKAPEVRLHHRLPRLIHLAPGGPNYTRQDMAHTHQSGVDSVISALRLALALATIHATQDPTAPIPAQAWLEATATVFMHHNRYELGPDRFNENIFIFNRLCSYLEMAPETLALHEAKQKQKSASWSLFHRRKDFIIDGAKELKSLAAQLWPAESPELQTQNILQFIKARTHFPLIREKLSTTEAFQFAPGRVSTIVPDTYVPSKNKRKGQKS
jgi:L-ascorbate metabolism protein UlaG (beta-lactamase superfamily)